MAVSAVTSRWKYPVAVSVAMLALACGDDDGGNGNQNPDPGNGGGTGVVLAQGVVGKECTAENAGTVCGSGARCATSQGFGTLTDVLQSIGISVSLPAPGGYCTVNCTQDSQCGSDGVCLGAIAGLIQGECRKKCTANTDCREGYECAIQAEDPTPDAGVGGGLGALGRLPSQCQALPPVDNLQPGQAGAACETEGDAGLMQAACGEGYCAAGTCTGTCVSDATCGAGAVCLQNGFYGSAGTCVESCTVDTDCQQYTAGGNIGCVQNDGRSLCGPKVFPLEPNLAGKPCTGDSDCGTTGTCADELGLPAVEAPGGYCTTVGCQEDAQCGTGGSCVGRFLAACYQNCTSNSDCRSGYTCMDRVNAADAMIKVCYPADGDDEPTNPTDSGTTPNDLDAGANTPDAG